MAFEQVQIHDSHRTIQNGERVQDYLLSRVPIVTQTETVEHAINLFRDQTYDLSDTVYVVSPESILLGSLPLVRLLNAEKSTALQELAAPISWAAHPEMDQEKMAGLALHHGLTAVPVVDKTGKFLGIVPPAALLSILRREHIEDLHRLAGIRRENVRAYRAMESAPLRRARDRLPWLLVGLAGSSVATLIVSKYEHVLRANVAVAFFVPAIVYLADAIGTQTEAIVVRGISLDRKPLKHLLFGELRTGFLIGLALACFSYPVTLLFFDSHALATSVTTAILAAGTVATSIGLLLPWSLAKFGVDPAFGSGPVATILQDIASLLIYFLVAQTLVL